MRTIGIDMGTGSLGWAITEKEGRDGLPQLREHGIMVFPEGIDRDQTGEKPKNQQRNKSRASRRRYFRRKRRKQMLLAVLIREGLCPLSPEALARWVKQDVYPDEAAFRDWFRMQPYALRAEALERPLKADELGRVLYHMDQRRGFRSNRKEGDGEQKKFHSGDADRGIRGYDETQQLLNEHGTMGQVAVFLNTQNKVDAVRRRFVKRDDYIKEFDLIWAKQRELHAKDPLGALLTEQLHDEIGAPFDGILFFQRPLRSQKGNVGKCRFEKNKRRAPQASPTAEVFEVLQTANNIKVNGQPLSMELRDRVINELFLKKDRFFTAEDLNKALVKWKVEGTSNYAGEEAKKVKFKSAEVIKDLAKLFGGKAWEPLAQEIFNDPNKKEWLDRWSAIKDAEHFNEISDLRDKGKDTGKKRDLKQYATENWGFDEKQLKSLKNIAWPQGYASMSHKAMGKMIPWLRQGMIFSHAAFLANVDVAFGERWKTMTGPQRGKVAGDIQAIIESMRVEKGRTELINGLVKQYRQHWDETKSAHGFWTDERRKEFDRAFENWAGKELGDQLGDADREALRTEMIGRFDAHIDEFGVKAPFIKLERADERIANYLSNEWEVGIDGLEKLYHPADIELYPEARGEELGSPFHPALNNPVALRALHALRFLINALLKSGAMDKDTRIRIELARELNSANERRAWQWFQSDMFDRQRNAEAECKKWFDAHMPGTSITSDAIERVWLMQEAEEVLGQAKCVYTNRALSMADVLGGTANTEVEHTWPIWRSLDDSKANKTLCDREYNRKKNNRIPAECENWNAPKSYGGGEPAAILPNVDPFREKMEHYKMLVEIRKQDSKNAQDPDARNKAIVQKNYYAMWYRYWKTKYEHFALESIPLGFTNRQQVEVGMITRYARAYLRTYFPRVDCVKGTLVSFMRKEWMGEKQQSKDRSNHFHHLVDAITMAATNKETTDRIAHDLRQQEGRTGSITPTKPWPSFTEDVLKLKDKVLVYHFSEDPLGRTSRYKVKIKGKQRIVTGSTVRGSLHKDTFYGRILWKDPKTDMKVLRTVKRSRIHDMAEGDIDQIVSEGLKEKIRWAGIEQVKADGGLSVEVKHGADTDIHIVKKLRLFTQKIKRDKNGVPMDEEDSLLAIKPHRDQVEGREHKHHLLAANEDNHFMGVYENAKSDRTFHILNLFELTKALQRGERKGFPYSLLPAKIEREVRGKTVTYELLKRGGRPVVLHKDQMVLLFQESPEEINWDDKADLSARLHKVRSFESAGLVMLVHHMEAQPISKLERTSKFVPNATGVRLRMSIGGLKALVENVDFKCHPNEAVVKMDVRVAAIS